MNQCTIKEYLADKALSPQGLLRNVRTTTRDVNKVLILALEGLAVVILSWFEISLP